MDNTKESSSAVKRWYLIFNLVVLMINLLLVVANLILLSVNAPAKNLGFDYCGVVVAIFGLLVTLLVAWNIYSVVDFRDSSKKIEFLSAKVEELDKRTYKQKLNNDGNDKNNSNA